MAGRKMGTVPNRTTVAVVTALVLCGLTPAQNLGLNLPSAERQGPTGGAIAAEAGGALLLGAAGTLAGLVAGIPIYASLILSATEPDHLLGVGGLTLVTSAGTGGGSAVGAALGGWATRTRGNFDGAFLLALLGAIPGSLMLWSGNVGLSPGDDYRPGLVLAGVLTVALVPPALAVVGYNRGVSDVAWNQRLSPPSVALAAIELPDKPAQMQADLRLVTVKF